MGRLSSALALLMAVALAGAGGLVAQQTEGQQTEVPEGSSREGSSTQSETARAQDEDAYDEDRDDEDLDDDDTADVDTETTIDSAVAARGWRIEGDLRPILSNSDRLDLQGVRETEEDLGFRLRFEVNRGLSKQVQLGVRLAGLCFVKECNPEFVLDSAIPSLGGLTGGQFTFDQLFVHWFRENRFDVAAGRLQTRFVLRGGVFAKSLDRNDSNNVNVTWTDGVQLTFRERQGWASSLIFQHNSEEGSGSIRRGLLDFADSSARTTYFFGAENIEPWGPVAQRAIDVSYLPSSLLKDGDPEGRREDYWGLVGRLAFRWPERRQGTRLRLGSEIGYAPETPTREASGLGGSGDDDGFAWDVVVSVMDFVPDHSIGVNYARTAAGWLLSPQFRPNDELVELRYQWRSRKAPLIEARVRWRQDLERFANAAGKRTQFDYFVRLTWDFKVLGP